VIGIKVNSIGGDNVCGNKMFGWQEKGHALYRYNIIHLLLKYYLKKETNK